MSAVSPSLAPSSNTTQPPSSTTSPPPQQPSSNTTQPPSSTTSPPPQQPSSPAPNSSVSPPPATSPPPPTRLAPPPSQLAPPPTVPSVPPPSQLAPPPSQSPPLSPPVASPPTSPSRPPPPPPSSPARRSPPPQSSVPPRSSPPLSPPPPSAPPPSDPAPPLPSPPQENSPPPAAVPPPRNSTSTPPQALPPVAVSPPPPPRNSTSTPPRASPPVAVSPPPPPRNSTSTPPRASPPVVVSPPPPPRNSTSTPPRASPPVVVSPPPPPRNSTSNPPPASPPVAVSPPPPSPPPSPLTPPPTNSPPSPTTPSSQPVPPSNSTPSLQLPPPPLPRSLLSPPPPSQNGSENSGPGSNSSGGIGTGAIVAIAVCGGILLLGFIGIALWCLKRHKKRNPPNDGYIMPLTLPSSTESDSSSLKKLSSAPLIKNNSGSDGVYTPSDTGGLSHSRNWFSYEELIKATNGFSSQNILGEGGFGFVYKGCLPDGREIAVKQLKIGGGQGEKEFKAEVDIISRVHHRHLVSLVGYCIQDNKRLLVYDYVPNNTLHFHLHGEDRPVLEWANRFKIAAGAARGIAYLHEDCNPRIIHRDIKPSNILLDYSYEAMVADFGLAKLALDANSHITTRVMGTFGYVAPEYASSGKLTEKSDVYSYGVVLLELITGRKPIDESQSSGDESLVEWARPLLSHAIETKEFESLVDPKLEKNYVESEMLCMIQVAASCVRHSASKRPRMGQVVRAFDSLAASDLMNGMRVGESQALNSAQQAENRWFQRAAFGSFSTDFFSEESSHT